MEAHHHHPSTSAPPWEIGRPQPALIALAESDGFSGRVVETGCGSGENTLMLAALGLDVVGLDIDTAALADAEHKARERGLDRRATFVRFDIRKLADLGDVFDTALDSLVFHSFSGQDRQEYVAGLHSVLRPGGQLHVLCYSDRQVGPPDVPHKVSLSDLDAAFGAGWSVERVVAATSASKVRPDGVAAWLVTCTRR